MGADFVTIDVETANPFMGSICQIGIVCFEAGQEVSSRSWLVDPQDYFDEMNVAIHGITSADVAGQPTFRQIHGELASLVEGKVVVCHTHFDRVSLGQACASKRLAFPACRWLDSARVARRTWPEVAFGGYGLAPLAGMLGIEFQHHDALEDARAAAQILLRAMDHTGIDIDGWFTRVEQAIDPSREDVRRSGDGDGPLVGHSIVFTGALEIPRADAADRAHTLGAAVEAGVTKRTTMLVVGQQDLARLSGHQKSNKHRKAEALIAGGQNIRIVAENDFMAF